MTAKNATFENDTKDAEIALLRKLVEAAYREGYEASAANRIYDIEEEWQDSEARSALDLHSGGK